MKRYLIVALAVLLALCSCGPKLVIVHCNDTHSHMDPVRGGEYDGYGGIIERAALVDSLRAKYGKKMLLLHAGDFNQGTSYYSQLGGSLEPKVINAMGYDCITLGNHELDNGIEDLAERLARIDCPVVCANCEFPPALARLVAPYAIIRKNRMKIGIIGMLSDVSTNVSNTIASRINQLDNVDVVNEWAPYLKESEGCDMVILLSHLGYGEDQDIIPKVHGVDLVVGGYSHTFVDDFVYVKDADGKEVPIVTSGCFGIYMGEIHVSR